MEVFLCACNVERLSCYRPFFCRRITPKTSEIVAISCNFDPAEKRARPDSAERMKRTCDAANHDKWFRERVEEGIRLADAPDAVWVSNDEVMAMGTKFREKWAKQAAGRVVCGINPTANVKRPDGAS